MNVKTSRMKYVIVSSVQDYEKAKGLFKEYAEALLTEFGINVSFEKFYEKLDEIIVEYNTPIGGIILIIFNNEAVGCVGVRRLEQEISELKRMYIKPAFHNKGFGKTLLLQAIELAKELGYKQIRLTTVPGMKSAIKLYQNARFVEIEPYCYHPAKGVRYYELILT
ncbi:MAG: GNAT family N-acetyltransferase [Bacteroidetes bacterium]|nr:MAG: GNAT family N-acetyltransferase [Bacteroidota bacterium]